MTIKIHNSVSEFADNYDAFIIDLWGVLHDGTTPYPGAIEALTNLRAAGKNIILLSNAPRQAHKVITILDELGFTRDMYDHVMTSGQATHDYLEQRVSDKKIEELVAPDIRHPTPYYYIGPDKDKDLIADLTDYVMVDDPKQAQFVIGTGFDGPGQEFAEKQGQIDACLENDLLLICPNPDRKVVKQDGRVWLCAGLIAEYYNEQGGEVISFGKPYEGVYDRCFELFAGISGNTEKSRVMAIGDSVHTDIAGANAYGIDSALCAGGILLSDLGIVHGQLPDIADVNKICERDQATPTIIVPSFLW